jgi:flagellar basal body P-ring formation protein FlgA
MRRAFIFLLVAISLPASAIAEALIARTTIKAGEALTASNVDAASDDLPAERWHGKEVRRTVYAGQSIDVADLRAPRLVFRNRAADVRYISDGLEISLTGRVMNDASVGEVVEIMNLQSKKIIQGVVMEEGWILVQ